MKPKKTWDHNSNSLLAAVGDEVAVLAAETPSLIMDCRILWGAHRESSGHGGNNLIALYRAAMSVARLGCV